MMRGGGLVLGALVAALAAMACGAPQPTAEPVAISATPPQAALITPRSAGAVVFETPSGAVDVTVEVAATGPQRRKGLMGRKSLSVGHGMLFVFEQHEVQTFWMRNTLIPLDMIFVTGEPSGRGARVVGVVHGAVPGSPEIRSVPAASRFVVEVPGGWAESKGIADGVPMRFAGSAAQ